jgi:cytochrome c peroxidase
MTRSAALLAASLTLLGAHAATPQELLAGYTAQAGAAASSARGEKFFAQTHGREWSCSSCHTARPTAAGRHASTGKPIEPLAPAANPQRFTDAAKTEKWFRRNCNDVLGRECSTGEKADVLAWLSALRP